MRSMMTTVPRISSALVLAALLSGCAASHGGMVAVAERYEGKTARQLGLPATLWCGDFADKVRRESGLTPVRSRRAIDQTKHARRVSRPVPGALMITQRGRRGNHVDLVVAVHGDGTLTVLGGNVAGAVTRRVVPARGIFVLPT